MLQLYAYIFIHFVQIKQSFILDYLLKKKSHRRVDIIKIEHYL